MFFGGRSVEHEVSIITAMQAISALDQERYFPVPVYMTKDGLMYSGPGFDAIESYRDVPALLKKGYPVTLARAGGDVVLTRFPVKLFGSAETPIHAALPAVHGANAEDGTVAGLCEAFGLPYAGCDVTASALCMDKAASKAVLAQAGLPVLPCVTASASEYASGADAVIGRIEERFEYPVIVKPNNLGSSVGVSKAGDREALADALDMAFRFTHRVLAEQCLSPMREINCAVLGDSEHAAASVCERPFGGLDFLSYGDKYQSGGAKGGMASAGRELPADIPQEVSERVRKLSVAAFQALDCAGVARVDCMIDDKTGEIYVNELNTIPGSLAFYLWEASGMSFSEQLTGMIKLALARKRRRDALITTIPTNILSGAGAGAKQSKTTK